MGNANLLQLRGAVAKELGAFVSGFATSGSTTASLVDIYNLRSTIKSTKFYENWYILRPSGVSGDQSRRVASYVPSSGSLTPDGAWVNAPTVGEYYELHGFIEPYTDMTDLINTALKRCLMTAEKTITPTALATRHSLNTITGPLGGLPGGGLVEEWQVRQVGVLSSGETRAQVDPYQRVVRGWVSNEGGNLFINHPGYTFNTTDTLYLRIVVGAHYLCRASGGTYGDQPGLASDTQEAPVSVEWLAPGALIEAFSRFSNILDPMSSQRMQADRLEYAARFTTLCRRNFRMPPQTFRPLVPMGPLPNNYAPMSY